MPPTVARASVRTQYHSRIFASSAAKTRLQTDIAPMPWVAETASITFVSGSCRCAWNHDATFESTTTIGSRIATFQATARKIPPASRKPTQPAIARARGDRLWACGLVRSVGIRRFPAVLVVVVRLGAAADEIRAGPLVGVDLDVARLQAQEVEGIGRAPRARRGRGPRVHHQGGNALDAVARRRVPDVRLVQVAREQHVGAAARELRERFRRAPDDLVLLVAVLRHVEGMVGDDDLRHA